MRAKTATCTLRVLEDLLKLGNIKITRIRQNWEQEVSGQFEMLLESADFDEVPENSKFPEATIMIHSEYCRHCNNNRVVKSELT